MPTPAQEISIIIESTGGWKGAFLAELREVILATDEAVSEAVKWKMPSKPLGSATWEVNGILCVADILKSAVRLTFPNGAQLKDPASLFNARMDSKVARAIDLPEGCVYDQKALKALIRSAIALNQSKSK